MSKFIGRKNELSILTALHKRPPATLVVIQGRRRIGKSRLIEEFAKGKPFYVFIGLAPVEGITAQQQREEFARKLEEYFGLPGLKADNWGDLFSLLAKQIKSIKGAVVLLDEISWMAHDDNTFLPKLKNAWDTQLKQCKQLMLVVCGSVSSWIEENILASTEFIGRITQRVFLKELTLQECNEFWGRNKDNISAFEKFTYLNISGGVPLYLEVMDPTLSAQENIRQLAFVPGSLFLKEFKRIFVDLFGRKSDVYEKIVRTLVTGAKELSELATVLKTETSGWLSTRVEELIAAGFITRDYTWNIATGEDSKLSQYRLQDNYLRFYLKFLEKNKDKIERGSFVLKSLNELENWSAVAGLQFENLVIHNRNTIKKLLSINHADVVTDNPFFQRPTTKQKGCQVDYLIQTKFNCLYLCEIKFSKKPLDLSVINEVKTKIMHLKTPKRFSCRPVLIHVNGVSDSVVESQFFSHIIDLGECFSENYA